jgi:hypothetical protein
MSETGGGGARPPDIGRPVKPMVIIEWFGISEFPRTFFKICGSLGDFCLGLPEAGNLMNVHYFSGILDF